MAIADNGDLVGRLSAGDRDALREAYERYKSPVLALAATMLGQRQLAWDVLHDVFIALARIAPRLAPDTDLRRYLLTAAANSARGLLAKARRAPLDCHADGVREPAAPPRMDPADVAAQREQADRLCRCLLALSDDQRLVVALHVYGGLTFREISEREGLSQNTVQSRYRYALANIRRMLTEVQDGR